MHYLAPELKHLAPTASVSSWIITPDLQSLLSKTPRRHLQASQSDGWLVSSRMLMIRIYSLTTGDKQVTFWKAWFQQKIKKDTLYTRLYFHCKFPTRKPHPCSLCWLYFSPLCCLISALRMEWSLLAITTWKTGLSGAGELRFVKNFWELKFCLILTPHVYTEFSGKMQKASLLTAQGQQHYQNAV